MDSNNRLDSAIESARPPSESHKVSKTEGGGAGLQLPHSFAEVFLADGNSWSTFLNKVGNHHHHCPWPTY